jgi:hypothetical protein
MGGVLNSPLRGMGGILSSPLRYTHEALRFLFILGKSLFPKLHICALHTRQLPALTKRPEQLGIFPEPRLDEFGPFLAESLQGCAQLRILLDESYEIKKRHEIGELAGIVVARLLVCHFFSAFAFHEKKGKRMLSRPPVYFATVFFRVQALRNAFCSFLSARFGDSFAVPDDLL